LKLSERFGKKINGFYAFPTAEKLAGASISDLRKCSTGFKAKYIKKTSQLIATKKFDIDKIKKMNYHDAKEYLIQLPGVGNKIADCVLLFAYDRLEAFPVDVWIKRIMQKYYFKNKKTSNEKIVKFAQDYFNGYAGYAQEYLFYWAKNS